MSLLRLDHLAVAAMTLDDGAAAVEVALGVPLAPGGHHPAMGTHNRLLSLGSDEYLEVIAIDPATPPPGRARWFGLDDFSGPPRLVSWVARCNDLEAATAALPGSGAPIALARGDLRWQMAVPKDGRLPLDGVAPALIQWEGVAHPAARLPDQGCRLIALRIRHPDPQRIEVMLENLMFDSRITVERSTRPGLHATIQTPQGPRVLE